MESALKGGCEIGGWVCEQTWQVLIQEFKTTTTASTTTTTATTTTPKSETECDANKSKSGALTEEKLQNDVKVDFPAPGDITETAVDDRIASNVSKPAQSTSPAKPSEDIACVKVNANVSDLVVASEKIIDPTCCGAESAPNAPSSSSGTVTGTRR